MEQTLPRCVNHPDVETRISCTTCDDPICTRCMRQGPVGQKCPSCARTPRSARAIGKPRHYVLGATAGLAVAVVGGLVANLALGRVGFGGIIIPGLIGFGVGRAVAWGASGQTARPFVLMAAGLGAVSGLLAHGLVLANPYALLGAAVAGYVAVRGLLR